MATVTSQLTRIHDIEGSLTLTAIVGGAGAGANTDVFIQGSQSVGRRISNATLKGWWLTDASGNDLSAAGIHFAMWMWITHYASATEIRVRLGSDQVNFDMHTIPLGVFPELGGWVRVWIHIDRTPENTGGTGLLQTAVDEFALTVSMPTVGGNADNVIFDAIDHATTGLDLTGTSGLWSDFVTADANSSNRYGVITEINGALFVQARLTLGTSSSLVFDDSAFVIIFPDQSLVAAAFMGITCDMQNASTNIDWADATIKSDGSKQGDLICTGTSGAWDAIRMVLQNLRTIDLTSVCTLSDSQIIDCDKLNQNGAIIAGCTIRGATTADGEAFIISDDPGLIDDCIFEFSDGHAIEITATGTYAMDGNVFNGYGAGGTNDAAIYNNSGGAVTLNISNGANPTIRNGASASTTVVQTTLLQVTVSNQNGDLQQNVNVRFEQSDGTLIAQGATNASGVFNFNQDTAPLPFNGGAIIARKLPFEDFEIGLNITSSGFDIPITLVADPDVNIPLS